MIQEILDLMEEYPGLTDNDGALCLKCHYGFSKNDFLESLINGEQEEKKFSLSNLWFARNSLLKSGAFGSRPRKQKPRKE